MTHQITIDAVRYVSRTYKDDAAHNRKMMRRHGDTWNRAVIAAGYIYANHGHRECLAVIHDMVDRAIDGITIPHRARGPCKSAGLFFVLSG